MDTKDLDSSDIKKQEELEDITTCCICTEVYTDPKALPCIHTFCLKCLQETGLNINRGPGDEMPCPICRRLFKIPPEGFHGLPKHFFIDKLIQLSKVSDQSAVTKALCSLCLEDSEEQEGKDIPTADAYCMDCKHKLCEECCSEHRKFKLTKNHKLMPINEYESGQNLMTDLTPSVCDVHEQKIMDVYCADCKTVVCAICFIEEHKNHEGSHVNKCVDGFRKQIEHNIKSMNECIFEAQMKKADLVKVKEEIQQMVNRLERDVEERKDKIKQLTDKHARRLLEGLSSERKSRLKEIQMATDDTDAYLSNLKTYNSYCQKIMDKGSVSDICRTVSNLSVRAMELQQQCQPIIERAIHDFKFCFGQSKFEELLEEDCGNLFGEIEEEGDLKAKKRSGQIPLVEQSKEIDFLRKENDKLKQELHAEKTTYNSLQKCNEKFREELEMYKATVKTLETNAEKLRKKLETSKADELRYKSEPVLVQAIKTKAAKEGKKSIRGLTILDKELFVVNEWSSDVEVYDSMKFSFLRQWKLKELIYPVDIKSCKRNKCLYILNFKGSSGQSEEIWRICPDERLIKNWTIKDDYGYGLSVTEESNVILTLFHKHKLNEYSPDGELIREINLLSDAGIRSPWHAIKLTNGNFVISHGYRDDDLHRVCVLDADAKLKKSFGRKPGSTTRQINRPIHLSVDGNGFWMVADQWNSRVLLLDSDLEFKRVILSKERHGLRFPKMVLQDESSGRLFVADNDSDSDGQILIFSF